MSERAAITIRMDATLLQALREQAAKHGHSVNSEIVNLLENSRPTSDKCRDFLKEEAVELEAQIPGIKWELSEARKRLGSIIENIFNEKDNVLESIKSLQFEARFYLSKVQDAERRLRQIKRVLGE